MYKNILELNNELVKSGLVKFQIKVSANSKINKLDFEDEIIKLKIAAPKIEGKANKAIIEFFSKELKVPKSKIKILLGEKSSYKTILIEI